MENLLSERNPHLNLDHYKISQIWRMINISYTKLKLLIRSNDKLYGKLWITKI